MTRYAQIMYSNQYPTAAPTAALLPRPLPRLLPRLLPRPLPRPLCSRGCSHGRSYGCSAPMVAPTAAPTAALLPRPLPFMSMICSFIFLDELACYYLISTLYCVPTCVSTPGGAGLGACAGLPTFVKLLTEAGFLNIRRLTKAPGLYFLCDK